MVCTIHAQEEEREREGARVKLDWEASLVYMYSCCLYMSFKNIAPALLVDNRHWTTVLYKYKAKS